MVHMHYGAMDATQDNDHNGGNGGGNGGGDVGYRVVAGRAIEEIGIGGGDGSLSEIFCGDIGGIGDVGRGDGTSHNGPWGLELSCLMSNRMGGRMGDNLGVPPFLIKLYLMVDDKATNSIISWGSSCTTFIISDEQRFIFEILPCYFKTSRFDNFICQLNNYGFKKKEWNRLEFEHEHFQEGKLHMLKAIKRKKQQSNVINKHGVPVNELKETFGKVRFNQKQISNRIRRFKYDIEKTLSTIQTNTKAMINKLPITFYETLGRKRTFLDIDMGTHLVDIEKDFQSISHQIEGLGSDDDCLKTLSDVTEKVITGYVGRGGERGSSGVGDGCRVPKFLHKLYNMVAKEEIDDLISWKLPCCDSFIIWDINKFATNVLPMYFKHTNFSSFKSQLNIYGFKKVSWEKQEYANEWFRQGRYDLLANIKRRSKSLRLTGRALTKVEMFSDRLKTLQQDQENKTICLSNHQEQIKASVNNLMERVTSMANIVEKMIQRSSENLENVKRARLGIEENISGNESRQEPEVSEMSSRANNKLEEQSCFNDLGIDPEVFEKIIMEDPWFE